MPRHSERVTARLRRSLAKPRYQKSMQHSGAEAPPSQSALFPQQLWLGGRSDSSANAADMHRPPTRGPAAAQAARAAVTCRRAKSPRLAARDARQRDRYGDSFGRSMPTAVLQIMRLGRRSARVQE